MKKSRSLMVTLFLINFCLILPMALAESPPPKPAGNAAMRLDTTQHILLRAFVARALSELAQVRQALRDKDNTRIADGLSVMRMQLEFIEALRPSGEFLSLVGYVRTDMDLEDNKQVLSKFMPLYRALDNFPASPPVLAAKKGLDSAKDALEHSDRDKVIQSLDAAADTLNVDRIDLPLKAAQDSLRSAISSMIKNDLPKEDILLSLEKNLFLVLEGVSSIK